MHIRLVAVGDRQPSWVVDAFNIYTGRFPRHWKFRCDHTSSARRSKNDTSDAAKQLESKQILDSIDASEQVVLLDERGESMTSQALAGCMSNWQTDGRNLCFVIGGPDGVSNDCRQRADVIWSLSSLTLPHGLARVLFAEQLYRAWTLQSGHPYHRD